MRYLFVLFILLGSVLPASCAENFRLALPGYKFQFPRDHASHPDFATEWWYYTGHLKSKNGRRFGYQFTFFRFALTPQLKGRTSKWATRDVIAGHFAITDETNGKFYFCDRSARAAAGLAGADPKTPHVWLNDWKLRHTGNKQVFQARGNSFNSQTSGLPMSISLTQIPAKPPVIHGINGFSQKAAGIGRASHYYSFTRLLSSGTIRLGNESFAVTGESWFDKEFGSSLLAENQTGWDWFSLQLSDGRELMFFQIRLRGGGIDPYSSGTLIEKNGKSRHLRREEFQITPLAIWTSAASGGKYPSKWRISVPREKIQLNLEPTVAAQELITKRSTNVTYWEGSIRVQGTAAGRPITGRGYVELTGYQSAFNATL